MGSGVTQSPMSWNSGPTWFSFLCPDGGAACSRQRRGRRGMESGDGGGGKQSGGFGGWGLPKQKQPQTDELLAASGKLPSFLTMSAIPSRGGRGGAFYLFI